MIIEFDCEVCGCHVSRKRSPANLRGNAGRFCSQRCHGTARKGTGTGPRPNHHFECAVCGKKCSVYRSPSAPTPTYCSAACTGDDHRGGGNPSYSGGRHLADTGYVRVLATDHPAVDVRGYVYEHRLVMERNIGRRLRPGEVVHHVNHVRSDNRIENLMLFATHSEHIKYHAKEAAK